MKTTMNKVMIVLQALAAAALLGAIKIWAPVCGKLLELVSGKQVFMTMIAFCAPNCTVYT